MPSASIKIDMRSTGESANVVFTELLEQNGVCSEER